MLGLENHYMKTGIVGGGLAGLTAAYRLSQKGQEIILFEKQAFTGGRVDHCVSVTTQAFQPKLYELLSELGLEEMKIPLLPTSMAMLMATNFVGYEDFPKMVASLPPADQAYFQKLVGEAMGNSFDVDNISPRLLELRKISFAEYLKDASPQFVGMMIDPLMDFLFMKGLDLSKISADYGLFQIRFGMEIGSGQAHTFEENVKIVTNVLEKKIMDAGSQVCLSSPVHRIKPSKNGFEITYDRDGKLQTEQVGKVILSTPLSVTSQIFPELALGEGVFYEKTKCIFVDGKLKSDRGIIMGIPANNIANLRFLFVAFPHEHQLYPMDIDKPINYDVLYDEYRVTGEREVEAAYALLKPGGFPPEPATNIEGAFVCGDFYHYPLLDTSVRTGEKAARLILT